MSNWLVLKNEFNQAFFAELLAVADRCEGLGYAGEWAAQIIRSAVSHRKTFDIVYRLQVKRSEYVANNAVLLFFDQVSGAVSDIHERYAFSSLRLMLDMEDQ